MNYRNNELYPFFISYVIQLWSSGVNLGEITKHIKDHYGIIVNELELYKMIDEAL